MTYQEILEIIKDNGVSVSHFAYESSLDIPLDFKGTDSEYEESLGLGEIKEVDQHGGEGMGSDWYSIKYFPKHDVYVKVEGWYESYNGTDFEDWDDACSEVKPSQKLVTYYL